MMGDMAATPSDESSFTARWVLPVDGPPLERGVVTIHGEQIIAIEPHGSRTAGIDLGNAAILPGLVNTHTHLDLSGLRGQCPPSPDFTGWLRQVIAHRRTTTSEQTQADIRAGIAECLRYGTTLVGDIASGGASWEALAEGALRAVVYWEMIGLSLDRSEQAAAAAAAWLEGRQPLPTCRPGLSPHAPYSAGLYLLRRAVTLAGDFRTPLACHVAETAEEFDLLVWRSGPFVPFLQEAGAWAGGRVRQAPGPGDADVEQEARPEGLRSLQPPPCEGCRRPSERHGRLLPPHARRLRPPAAPVPRFPRPRGARRPRHR
jgi:hypothetical protein